MDLSAGISSSATITNSTANLMQKMTQCQIDCHNQVRDLIQVLSSWQEEAHRQMSSILSSHSKQIDMGFNGLVEEFNDLHAQISVLREDRNGLLETVANLNDEIRQMGAKQNLGEHDVQEDDNFEVDIQEMKMEYVASLKIPDENVAGAKIVVSEDILEESLDKQDKRNLSKAHKSSHTLTSSDFNSRNNIGHVQPDPLEAQDQVLGTDMEETISKENLPKYIIHSIEDFGQKYKLEEEDKKNTNHVNGKMHLCDSPGCNKGFPKSWHLKEHKRIHTGGLRFMTSAKFLDFLPHPLFVTIPITQLIGTFVSLLECRHHKWKLSRREAIHVHVGHVQCKVCPARHTDDSLPESHGGEAIQVSPLQQDLLAERDPSQVVNG